MRELNKNVYWIVSIPSSSGHQLRGAFRGTVQRGLQGLLDMLKFQSLLHQGIN